MNMNSYSWLKHLLRMEDSKRKKIIEAATKVFAVKGYQYATVSDIAKNAGISTGLVYSYFENKLDILLSIILSFLRQPNQLHQEKAAPAAGPRERLHAVLHNFEDLLLKDRESLNLVKILNEALPHIVMIKEESLQKKRSEIIAENKKMLMVIDGIIADGQTEGVFDTSLNPGVMRQVLCGAIERVIYGLFFTAYSGEKIGYNETDAHRAVLRLIDTFICTKV